MAEARSRTETREPNAAFVPAWHSRQGRRADSRPPATHGRTPIAQNPWREIVYHDGRNPWTEMEQVSNTWAGTVAAHHATPTDVHRAATTNAATAVLEAWQLLLTGHIPTDQHHFFQTTGQSCRDILDLWAKGIGGTDEAHIQRATAGLHEATQTARATMRPGPHADTERGAAQMCAGIMVFLQTLCAALPHADAAPDPTGPNPTHAPTAEMDTDMPADDTQVHAAVQNTVQAAALQTATAPVTDTSGGGINATADVGPTAQQNKRANSRSLSRSPRGTSRRKTPPNAAHKTGDETLDTAAPGLTLTDTAVTPVLLRQEA